MSVDEAAEELDVPVGSQLAEVAVRNVAVLVKLRADLRSRVCLNQQTGLGFSSVVDGL